MFHQHDAILVQSLQSFSSVLLGNQRIVESCKDFSGKQENFSKKPVAWATQLHEWNIFDNTYYYEPSFLVK